MPATFKAAGAPVSYSSWSATTGRDFPYPAGVGNGDLLILPIFSQTTSINTVTPSGWTKLFGPVAASGTSYRVYLFYKIAGPSEPSSVNVKPETGTGSVGGIMSAWSGCDTAAPFDVYATAGMPTSGTTGTCPSVTTTKANTHLARLYWGWHDPGTITPDPADTERYDVFFTDLTHLHGAASRAQAATGPTGTATITFPGTPLFGGLAVTAAIASTVGPPTADFTATPTSVAAGGAVAFTDTSTGAPTSWLWDFGDGTTSTSQNPTHAYTTSGMFTVALTATNAGGSNTKTRPGYITVTEPIVYAPGGGITIY